MRTFLFLTLMLASQAHAQAMFGFDDDAPSPKQQPAAPQRLPAGPLPPRPPVAPVAPIAPQTAAPELVGPQCPQMTADANTIGAMVQAVTRINNPFGFTMKNSREDTFTLVNLRGRAHLQLTGSYNMTVDLIMCRNRGGTLSGKIYGGSYDIFIEPAAAGRSVYLTNSSDGERGLFSHASR